MTSPDLRRFCLPLAALLTLSLSACASAKSTGAAAQHAEPAAAASTPRPKPSPSPTTLTKAQFVTKMDAVCTDVIARLKRLPKPRNSQDLAGIAADMQGILTLNPPYFVQAEALVNRSADKTTLTSNWLRLEKSDFAVGGPVYKRFIADVKAGNRAAVVADAQALEALPDHSQKIAGFMSGYGLKVCATLQNGS